MTVSEAIAWVVAGTTGLSLIAITLLHCRHAKKMDCELSKLHVTIKANRDTLVKLLGLLDKLFR
jgi:hypothetical protein